MNTMDQIKVRYGKDGKLISIQEFLKIKNLSGITKKIQDSTKTLYQLNATENPLFHFPDFPDDAPLIIDCTTPTEDDCAAHYRTGEHIIEFVRKLHDNPHLDNHSFTEILAHELTHAEQDVEEITEKQLVNGLQYHQINLLMEGQAFAKERMVRSMLEGGTRYLSDSERINAVASEIKWLIKDSFYRNRWAGYRPIGKDDKPLTSVPKAFRLSNNLLSSIWTFPKVLLRPENKSPTDIQENPNEIYDYFALTDNVKERAKSANKLLEILLFTEDIKSEKIPQTLEMLYFLLNLQDQDGKPVFSEHQIDNVFFDKACFEGIEESKLLKEVEKTVDSRGKKVFPDNFSEKAKGMTPSELAKHISNYFDAICPEKALDLDEDLTESEKKEEEKPSPQPKLRALLKKANTNPTPRKQDKTSAMLNANLAKKRRQAGE